MDISIHDFWSNQTTQVKNYALCFGPFYDKFKKNQASKSTQVQSPAILLFLTDI